MTDFWLSSGYHLLRRDSSGQLVVTDDFLRAYLDRPELAPADDACAAERALHHELKSDPRLSVPQARLALLTDADARENYAVLLAFRDRLVRAGTLEAAYLNLFRGEPIAMPPLFLNQMVHAILRGTLDGCTDPFRARAAELLFRSQRVTIEGDAVMLGDEETVEMRTAKGVTPGAPLITGRPRISVDLDILTPANAAGYWARSDRFDLVLDIGFTRPGLDAFCRVLEAWIRHMLGAEVRIHPVQSVRDERWVWHVGLDAESSGILNDLYNGHALAEDRRRRLLALFRLEFRDPAAMLGRVAGRPVYLGLAMTEAGRLLLKPQNLLANLPLAGPV